MAHKVRLFADPGALGRVGIGVDGEVFEDEDAERLIGQGIATRSRKQADTAPPPADPPPDYPAEREAE